MTLTINKRQQARNERALQDLIRNVPGNDRCADCGARNPGWASWSLGIFLCMRCAALHRKLGTHISKVKSLSMDTWSTDQVENMKKTGNNVSNRAFNPRNVKPSPSTDVEEIDMIIEKFIREKYQKRAYAGGNAAASPQKRTDTGSTNSTDDYRPAVPPKSQPGYGLSLRSASSVYPQQSRPAPPVSPSTDRSRNSDNGSPGSTWEGKLKRLKEMGFVDEKRNATVLRAVDGNMEKATQALVRLAQDDPPAPPPKLQSQSSTGNNSPQSVQRPSLPVVGASVVSQQSTGQTSNNPFHAQAQQPASQQPSFEGAFQNMSIQTQPQPQPQQQQPAVQAQAAPLFPNNTGSYQQLGSQNPFLRTFTPPISPSPSQYQQTVQYQNPPPQQNTAAGNNPFLRQSRSQEFASSIGFHQQTNGGMPLFYQQQDQPPPVPQLPSWVQSVQDQPQQLQPAVQPQYQTQYQQQPQPQPQPASPFGYPNQTQAQQSNPFFSSSIAQSPTTTGQQTPSYPFPQQYPQAQQYPQQQQPQQPVQFQQHAQSVPQSPVHNNPYLQQQQQQFPQTSPFQQPQQPMYPQAAGRYDKASILALYNQPQLAPQRTFTAPSLDNAAAGPQQQQQQQPQPPFGMPQRSASNPFAGMAGNGAPASPSVLQASRESMQFAGSALAAGRHSPDAFTGLSARYR